MKKVVCGFAAALLCVMGLAVLGQTPAGSQQAMSFFVTSVGLGDGANLGGLTGADYHCQMLAEAVGSTKTFQAYLSTKVGMNAVTIMNARERIGKGPWYNAKGVMIARNVEELHGSANNLNKQTALTEKGTVVNGVGDQPNTHDIMTGSQPDGMAYPENIDNTCNNYTSARTTGGVQLGHSDRMGGNNPSWNSAHMSRGCSQANLASTGGAGLFYCFAID
jgi:hypothetical protein